MANLQIKDLNEQERKLTEEEMERVVGGFGKFKFTHFPFKRIRRFGKFKLFFKSKKGENGGMEPDADARNPMPGDDPELVVVVPT